MRPCTLSYGRRCSRLLRTRAHVVNSPGNLLGGKSALETSRTQVKETLTSVLEQLVDGGRDDSEPMTVGELRDITSRLAKCVAWTINNMGTGSQQSGATSPITTATVMRPDT